MQDGDLIYLAKALNTVLRKLYLALNNPDYVLFIHTSPIKKSNFDIYDFYHWHIEIMPRFYIVAGMELGTNVFINTVDPDEAAEKLRNADV